MTQQPWLRASVTAAGRRVHQRNRLRCDRVALSELVPNVVLGRGGVVYPGRVLSVEVVGGFDDFFEVVGVFLADPGASDGRLVVGIFSADLELA